MLDIQFIRDNAELVKEKSKQKLAEVDIDTLLERDEHRRELQTQAENLRQQRNGLAAAAKNQRPSPEQIEQGRQLKAELAEIEEQLVPVQQEFQRLLKQVPNMPLDDVPVGYSEDENVVSKQWGDKPEFGFTPKTHWELGEALDVIDKERAAKIAGARFAYLKGGLVELQFALVQFVLRALGDTTLLQKIIDDNNLDLSAKPFTPVLPPVMMRTDVYEATGRLKAEEVTYKLADDDLWLTGSAEHSLCSMYAEEILAEDQLPIRYIGYSTSFRREAGAYGKDTNGIIRMHQFDKLEMESFTTGEHGLNEHLLFVAIQEHLMQQLNIPYRVLLKCTADIGTPNARGIDIEAWMPGQDAYRETHSADFMTDYQARGLRTRVRRGDGSIEFAHTNDATAFAMGRTLVAVIENCQTEGGHIRIPEVLKPYMGGKELI